jgi:hypothetical protein
MKLKCFLLLLLAMQINGQKFFNILPDLDSYRRQS